MVQLLRRFFAGVPLRLLAALSVIVASGGTSGWAQAARTMEDVRLALDRGAYAEAERAAAELRGRTEEQYGAESLELAQAQDLLVDALIKNGHAGAPGTLALAERNVQLKERHTGRDHLETASSLHNMGTVRLERGEFGSALAAHQRGLSIRSSYLAADDSAVADSRDDVASALIQLERYEEARQALMQSQPVRERQADRSPIPLARTLELVGWLNRYWGKYAVARESIERALAIRRRLTPGHADLVSLLELRGDVLYLTGDIAGARTVWTEAVALGNRTLRPEHSTIPGLRRRQAVIAKAFGSLLEGRQLLERGLEIADKSLAPCNPEVPGLLNDLASAVAYDGEYAEARGIYRRALAIRERCLGPAHSFTAGIVFNEANLALKMGDLVEAERLHTRAVRIWSAGLGPNHPFVARGLDALASAATLRKQTVRAQALSARALTIRRFALGNDHPQVARTLFRLAQTNIGAGRLDLAMRQLNEAIVTYRRVGVTEEPADLAFVLALRADIESRRGDFTAARATLAEALTAREGVYGKTHTRAAETRAELAATDFALGHDAEAVAGALDAEKAGRDQFRFTARYLPERQALAYADKRPKGLDVAVSIAAAGPADDLTPILDSVIQSRSLTLDELGARARSTSGADAALASSNATLVAARQRFANLMLRSVDEGDAVQRTMLDEARLQKEDAERAVAERSVTVRGELAQAKAGIDDVKRALPPRSALISFVRYDRTTFVENAAHVRLARTTPSYLAFVMRAGESDVTALPLGSAAGVDGLIARWREQTTAIVSATSAAEAEKAYRVAGSALRQRVWDPLQSALKNAATVFVVPDGSLNLVSMAALPVGRDRYVIDEGLVIHYLSAERDLVSDDLPTSAPKGLLAVGGAAFDDASSFARGRRASQAATVTSAGTRSVATLRANDSTRLGVTCGTFQSLQFQALAGTGREAREIAALWTGSSAKILENREADERTFKREAPGHRVLHLATHGFFLGGACPTGGSGTRSIGGLSTSQKNQSQPGIGESPLLLSGLALAGANRRRIAGSDEDDGILTAEEVTALNLEGVEWAVLSACDTGLGQVKAGEGVFGLRRAFQVAGARTVIMSLWSVDDQAARVWMRALYEGRLQKHLSTADAMHEASLSVLRARRARGQSTHPFFWGAFVAAGDWR